MVRDRRYIGCIVSLKQSVGVYEAVTEIPGGLKSRYDAHSRSTAARDRIFFIVVLTKELDRFLVHGCSIDCACVIVVVAQTFAQSALT